MLPRSTRTLWTDPAEPDPRAIEAAAEILKAGGLVAFATETVYGLGADATDPEVVARIFEAKGRPSSNPLIVHASDAAMARRCVADWPEAAEILARAFWPGPLTLVLPRSEAIPDVVSAGLATVGVRVPRPESARNLIAEAGFPLAAPSANRSNGVSPTLAKHVLADLGGRIDLILDSGQTTEGLESTVLELTTREPRVLRPGPISAAEISRVLGGVRIRPPESAGHLPPESPAPSPGQGPVHYAPTTRAVRVDSAYRLDAFLWPARSALIVVGEHPLPSLPSTVAVYRLTTPTQAAVDLYVVLRDCDGLGVDLIVVLPPPHEPAWEAVRDRLHRATVEWRGEG